MTNRNVIDIINRLMAPNAERVAYSASEVFAVVTHGYYFIRPGKNTFKFIDKIVKILDNGCKEDNKKHPDMKHGVQFNLWLWGKISTDALHVARSMFDKEYYASQVVKMCGHEEYNEHLLKHYMYWLDEKELVSVFEGILTFKHNFDAFISDEEFKCMIEELKECCIHVIENSRYYMMNYDEHLDNINNTLDFCFEYLCRETIIEIICSHIDIDPLMLAYMVKAFKYSNSRTAAEYTGLAIRLVYEHEVDVFNPHITDMKIINWENYDFDSSNVIYSNKAGKTMLA